MLAQISMEKFLDWQAYDALEPFGSKREDYRAASIRQAIFAGAGVQTTLEECTLPFEEPPPPVKKPWKDLFSTIKLICGIRDPNVLKQPNG